MEPPDMGAPASPPANTPPPEESVMPWNRPCHGNASVPPAGTSPPEESVMPRNRPCHGNAGVPAGEHSKTKHKTSKKKENLLARLSYVSVVPENEKFPPYERLLAGEDV